MVKRKEICQELINITPNEIEQLVRRVLGATRGELESHKISALGIAFLLSADKCGLNIEEAIANVLAKVGGNADTTSYGSAVYATKPGDGSAREQAASCQRVLGGSANFAVEYATKRYRSNLINWGMMPFCMAEKLEVGDYVFVPEVLEKLRSGATEFDATIVRGDQLIKVTLSTGELTPAERKIIECGCLMNYYNKGN